MLPFAECPSMPTQYVYPHDNQRGKQPSPTFSNWLVGNWIQSIPVNYELTNLINEVNSYKNLQLGWDGDDSIPIPHEVISNAIAFIKSLGPFADLIDEDYIYPTGDGTIVIDFQNEKDLVSVEIRKNSVGYFYQTQEHIAEVNSESFVGIPRLPQKVENAIRKVWERRHYANS